jgi:hypothetical protein
MTISVSMGKIDSVWAMKDGAQVCSQMLSPSSYQRHLHQWLKRLFNS